jgi:hypothetical protein
MENFKTKFSLKIFLVSVASCLIVSSCKSQDNKSNVELKVNDEVSLKLSKTDSNLFVKAVAKAVKELNDRQPMGEPEPFDQNDFLVKDLMISEGMGMGQGSIYFTIGNMFGLSVEPRSDDGELIKKVVDKYKQKNEGIDWINYSIEVNCVKSICTMSGSQKGGAAGGF